MKYSLLSLSVIIASVKARGAKWIVRYLVKSALNPALRSLGYCRTDKKMGLPQSIYFKNEDSFGSIRQIHRHYLRSSGWLESKSLNQSVENGEYIPWTSYAFTSWVKQRNLTGKNLLEFGTGASTIFWQRKFGHVIGIETDCAWRDQVTSLVADTENVSILPLCRVDTFAADQSNNFSSFKETFNFDLHTFPELKCNFNHINFDILVDSVKNADWIFIDGGARNFYTAISVDYAKPGAVIVLDNSDSDYTLPARKLLKGQGFAEIPFHSLGPLNPFSWTTSVFVKDLAEFI